MNCGEERDAGGFEDGLRCRICAESDEARGNVAQAAREHAEIAVEDLGVGVLVGYIEDCDEVGYSLRGRYLLWANLLSATTDTHDAKEDAKAWEAGRWDA